MNINKIKKMTGIILCLLMIFMIAACGEDAQQSGPAGPTEPPGESGDKPDQPDATNPVQPPDPPKTNLTGTPEEILGELMDALKDTGIDMPMSLPPTEVAPDLSQYVIGLSEDTFNNYVESAYYSTAAIGTHAHELIVILAKDASFALDIKKIVSSDGGYDPMKLICAFPERTIVVDSGLYVMLASAKAPVVEAAIDIFTGMAGSTGEVITFFEHEGGDDPGPGGGLLLP